MALIIFADVATLAPKDVLDTMHRKNEQIMALVFCANVRICGNFVLKMWVMMRDDCVDEFLHQGVIGLAPSPLMMVRTSTVEMVMRMIILAKISLWEQKFNDGTFGLKIVHSLLFFLSIQKKHSILI